MAGDARPPRRSEFARHFGPAALRREVRARFDVEATPRRVGRDDPDAPLRAAIAPIYGGRLVAAWAARVRAAAVVDSRRISEVWAVCALYAGGGPARVVWGAVRLDGARPPGTTFHYTRRLFVGRATGPAFRALAAPSDPDGPAVPARLYATNVAGECPTCGAACRARDFPWLARRDGPYPCAAGITAHEDADRYTYPINFYLSLAGGCARGRVSDHAPLRGLRRAAGRVLPPARLAAGVAYYRDAPKLAAATARLGRRGPAALRHTYASAD